MAERKKRGLPEGFVRKSPDVMMAEIDATIDAYERWKEENNGEDRPAGSSG